MSQAEVRCEWGLAGLATLRTWADVVVVVDVLSFSTAVDVAVSRGACVLPATDPEHAQRLAATTGAVRAGRRGAGPSLSPASMLQVVAGDRIVLPSPNGARLSYASEGVAAIAGCLRNRRAVAAAASRRGSRIAVIPAGERWPDGSLRPALEDWLGAGAIVAALGGARSPEAIAAEAAFDALATDLHDVLLRTPSGCELVQRGFEDDVRIAAALDASAAAPLLRRGAYADADAR